MLPGKRLPDQAALEGDWVKPCDGHSTKSFDGVPQHSQQDPTAAGHYAEPRDSTDEPPAKGKEILEIETCRRTTGAAGLTATWMDGAGSS